jgi:hypothetical protein
MKKWIYWLKEQKNAYNHTVYNAIPGPLIHYQNENNEGMAEHLGAHKDENTYRTLQKSSTTCAHKKTKGIINMNSPNHLLGL